MRDGLKETGDECYRLSRSTSGYMNVHDRRMVKVKLLALSKYIAELAQYLEPSAPPPDEYSNPEQHPF